MPKSKKSDLLGPWLDQWPRSDREAMERAFEQSDGCEFVEVTDGDRRGLAAHWGDDFRFNNIVQYTYWIRSLERQGALDPCEAAHERTTTRRLAVYRRELESVSPYSRLTYMRGIRNVLRVIAPDSRQEHLVCQLRVLKRLALPSRDQRHLLVPPSDMFYAGLDRMNRVMREAESEPLTAMVYGDGLMMAAIVCKAVRKRNFVGMLLERNIRRNVADSYEVHFRAVETKARRRIQAELSSKLTPYLDHWFAKIRPLLLRGRESDAMWITSTSSDMTAATFYKRFCRATEEELGVRINPHLSRKIVATGVAIASPTDVRIIQSLLDQKSDQSEAYNLADDLTASDSHLGFLEERRQRAINRTFGIQSPNNQRLRPRPKSRKHK